MAIEVKVIWNATTIYLSSVYGLVRSYVPQAPDAEAGRVVDTIEMDFTGGNSNVDYMTQQLEIMFRRARDRMGGAYGMPVVYLVVTIDSSTWRSPILDGKIVTAEDSWLKWERAAGTRRVSLIVEREAWWEDNTIRDLTISNVNTPLGTTTGLNVYNCNDASGSAPNKRTHVINVGTYASGDVPAPLKIEATVKSAAGLCDLMISQNVYSGPGSLINYFENGSDPAVGTVMDAACSGGSYDGSSAGPGTGYVNALITSGTSYLAGGYYRIIARVAHNGAVTITPGVSEGGIKFLGKPVRLAPVASNFWWWDLGVVQIPGNYVRGASYSAVYALWEATLPAGVGESVDAWFIAPLDGWKRATFDKVLATNEGIVIDELEGQTYGVSSLGKVNAYATVLGAPLMVYPNIPQCFYLAWNTATLPYSNSAADITAYLSVKMTYRPRRRTL